MFYEPTFYFVIGTRFYPIDNNSVYDWEKLLQKMVGNSYLVEDREQL